jgi:hypothetical protein
VTITLINTTRRIKVINLPHDIYCAAAGRCACLQAPGRDKRRIASSLTLPAGSITPGLDEAVLLVPEVARDVRAGELRVRREAPAPKNNTNPSRKAPRRSGRKNER